MKVVFQTEDGKIFSSRDDAAEHEKKIKQVQEHLEVWVLNMPGTPYDRVQVVRKSEYDKLKKEKQ